MPFGMSARRPVHNHALVSTAELPDSTWFKTGRCYAGTLTASGLTAFNQSLADQDLSGLLLIFSARYRMNFNNINSLQTSCFFLLHFNIYSL